MGKKSYIILFRIIQINEWMTIYVILLSHIIIYVTLSTRRPSKSQPAS